MKEWHAQPATPSKFLTTEVEHLPLESEHLALIPEQLSFDSEHDAFVSARLAFVLGQLDMVAEHVTLAPVQLTLVPGHPLSRIYTAPMATIRVILGKKNADGTDNADGADLQGFAITRATSRASFTTISYQTRVTP